MTKLHVAAAQILISQLLLLWVAVEPNETSAIWFTFVGTPCLVLGEWFGWGPLRQEGRMPPEK